MRKSDDALREAVNRFHEMELDALPSNSYLAERYSASPAFSARIDEVIRANRRRGMVTLAARRAAGVFVGLLAGLILLCTINEGIRAECLQFLRKVIGDMTYYTSPVTTSSETEAAVQGLELGYVPEGFELVYKSVRPKEGVYSCIKRKGKRYIWISIMSMK